MRIYDIAFCVAGFFILGVFVASLKLDFLIIVIAAILIAVLFLLFGYLRRLPTLFWLSALCLTIIIGAFYYFAWNNHQIKNINIVFDKKISFQGLIVQNPKRGDSQQLVIKLGEPYSGNILAGVQPYPSFGYGDVINFEGIVKKPEPAG